VQIALHTGAVVLAWLCIGVVLAGCGYLIRRLLVGPLFGQEGRGLACADVWIGLAALSVYLLVWNLFWAVGSDAWLLPAALGVVGAMSGALRLRGALGRSLRPGVFALAAVGVFWFGNQALGPAEDYDYGLYHLSLIDYAEKSRAIPGLANLHVRLGTGDTHLLFVSLLDRGLWAGAGAHLADGLLAALLIVDVGARFAVRRSRPLASSFTDRLALMLVPATVLVAEIRPTHRVSSPNLDFAAFILCAAGLLYLAEWVERRSPTAALTATASLALVSTSRPLYWLPTGFALMTVLGAARRRRALRTATLVGALPLVLLLGWTVRQAILSGYPLFPSTLGRLPVDWRVPASVVRAQNRIDDAWARWAGADPNAVLGSWHWLSAWWLPRQRWQLDMVFPPMLLSCLVPSLVRKEAKDRERAKRTRPMLAVVVPSVATLVAWFFIAPDPRFAWAPIWLVPSALTAWALPTVAGPLPRRRLALTTVAAAAAAAALAAIGVHDIKQLLPAAIIGWAVVAAFALPVRLRHATLLAYAATFSVLLAAVGVLVDRGNVHLVAADRGGKLGTPPVAEPSLVEVRTSSGLDLFQPTNGGDQCWQVLFCVPAYTAVNPELHLRGSGVGKGFSVRARSSRSAHRSVAVMPYRSGGRARY
jgi:hypothetical protein